MQEALNQDFSKIETLFRLHYKTLRAYAFRLVYDLDVAEDIVQDVFLSFWNNRGNINYSGAVKSYLFRSVQNKAINYLASKKYTEEESLDKNIDLLELSEYACNHYEEYALYTELLAEIEVHLASLPEQQRKVFVLSRMQDMKINEIAEVLKISHKTVEKHLYKALAEIRNHLKGNGLLAVLFSLFLLKLLFYTYTSLGEVLYI